MNLDTYAQQRLSGLTGQDLGHYTRALNAVRGRFPTVEAVREATDAELMARGRKLGPIVLAYLRELVGQ